MSTTIDRPPLLIGGIRPIIMFMLDIVQSSTFRIWIAELRDRPGARRITLRIERLRLGNFGDHRSVGDGVAELRMTFGPGYRVYYTRESSTLIVLLAGGDKSPQAADIARAKAIAAERKSNGRDFHPV